MGQSSSVHAVQVIQAQAPPLNLDHFFNSGNDLISKLPDDCFGLIFQSLSSGDRKSCSLVSKRWFVIEAQSRQRLHLKPQSDVLSIIPALFSRFDSITNLTLRFNRSPESLDDEALSLIARECRKLIRINLRGCREVTEIGMAALGMHAKSLKKFSCGSCTFGVKGMNALLDNCASLEVISVKRLHGIKNSGDKMIGPGVAASLKAIRLKELHNGQCFSPLIVGSNKLRSLKLLQCSGDWDNVVKMVACRENSCLFEVHFDRVQLSDVGLSALSNCLELETLHIIKTVDCTNFGIISVLEKCSLLRKLHIDGWRTNQIGDQGLVSIGKHGANLQELVLMGVNPSLISIEAIASGCKKLERLAICGSKTVADAELSCIATKCAALKKLCIKSCPISDKGIVAFAPGCPNLMKIKVKKCVAVTSGAEALLRLNRRSIIINIDVCELEVEAVDAIVSDVGTQGHEAKFLPMVNQEVAGTKTPNSPKSTTTPDPLHLTKTSPTSSNFTSIISSLPHSSKQTPKLHFDTNQTKLNPSIFLSKTPTLPFLTLSLNPFKASLPQNPIIIDFFLICFTRTSLILLQYKTPAVKANKTNILIVLLFLHRRRFCLTSRRPSSLSLHFNLQNSHLIDHNRISGEFHWNSNELRIIKYNQVSVSQFILISHGE